jgi:hypothetical protein
MKAHILTAVVIDHAGLGAKEVVEELHAANFPNDCIHPRVGKVETFELGEWDDYHPLNQADVDQLKWLRENAYAGGKRSAAMCTSFVAPLSDDDRHVCLRCGWNHKDEREKAAIKELRRLLEKNEQANVYLGYHDRDPRHGRNAIHDMRLLLDRLDRLEAKSS